MSGLFLQFRNVKGVQKVCMIYNVKGKEVVKAVRSVEQVALKQRQLKLPHVGISSTLNWPEDETDDLEQINLAELLTGVAPEHLTKKKAKKTKVTARK